MIEIPKNKTEVVRIERTIYHGVECLNIRVWYEAEDGEMRPSKKGIAVRIEQAADLIQAIETVTQD